jgi:hypothetical protein
MITRKQAEQVVYEHMNVRNPQWPDMPEMIIVRVEEHELGWVMYYTSRIFHETGNLRHALAGNAPYLVSREDGTMIPTGTAPPFAERLRAAEQKMREHLAGRSFS